ncbi:hypothetical protein M0802_009656 [Mischocyttarus mexicanus]|nr:hypothetical protein M0802_009656 [Mischocyttarus mexicanus]
MRWSVKYEVERQKSFHLEIFTRGRAPAKPPPPPPQPPPPVTQPVTQPVKTSKEREMKREEGSNTHTHTPCVAIMEQLVYALLDL